MALVGSCTRELPNIRAPISTPNSRALVLSPRKGGPVYVNSHMTSRTGCRREAVEPMSPGNAAGRNVRLAGVERIYCMY